ncbi:MAG: hypothetical protein K2Y23_27110 [Cyanobacteria bacterium]|nr:hypothetical protein [Cyanobacteriota bacterium]
MYAINHVGLGHVARLSIVQRFLSRRQSADCYFFSESRHAGAFFSCPGVLVDGEGVGVSGRSWLIETGLQRAIDEVRPDVLVCDTYWPEASAAIAGLIARGGRAVLILRMTDSPLMRLRLRAAVPVFDTILLPHHPREIRWTYRRDPTLLRQLDSPQVVPVGPLCRTARRPAKSANVIFSVGGGGEWPGVSKSNTLATFLGAFAGASRLMTEHGYSKPTLAAGAFLRPTPAVRASFDVCRTQSLHTYFGPRTIVVTRGGYNTVWEAVAARSPLVVCGTRNRIDDIKARSAFVQHEGLGRSVVPDPRALFAAIVRLRDPRLQSVSWWSGVVNTGLPLVADEIMGGVCLRAREPEREYAPSNAPTAMTSSSTRLVARFEDVDPRRPSHAVCAAARLALDLGYDTRLAIAQASDAAIGRKVLELLEGGAAAASDSGKGARALDCVPVLVWPGPRVRNELRIFEEIAEKRRRGVNTGLSIHADRLPLFLVEYLLRAFSLHNR